MSQPDFGFHFNLIGAIDRAAQAHGLDPRLVAAVVKIESGGNPWAMRFEPAWGYGMREAEFAKAIGASVETELKAQATSWGLMQVMGTVARELGFRGWLSQLCEVDLGLAYGCAHLAKKVGKYGPDPATVYAAYNAGSPRRRADGLFVNQDAVSKFLRYYGG